jgi:hypothetical protein
VGRVPIDTSYRASFVGRPASALLFGLAVMAAARVWTNWSASALPGGILADRIVVKKSAWVLFIYRGPELIRDYLNVLGRIGRAHRFIDWTDGCITVTDCEIDEIRRVVPDGLSITIEPIALALDAGLIWADDWAALWIGAVIQ